MTPRDVRHVVINPMLVAPLDPILADHEKDGWALLRIIAAPFETVLVFERSALPQEGPDRPLRRGGS